MLQVFLQKKFPTRVSELPFFLRPFGVLARKVLFALGVRIRPYKFESDGMATNHNVYFMSDDNFSNSYSRSVSGAPFDYGIPWRVHQAIWCANYGMNLCNDAIFVELGTGRGFVMSAVLHSISTSNSAQPLPKVFLFDTFSPFETDGLSRQDGSLGLNVHYASNLKEAQANFSEWETVYFVQGELPSTLSFIHGQRISFLHVDLNAAEIEAICLDFLWDQIVDFGIILFDDFANAGYPESARIIGDFLKNRGQSILVTPSGQGIVLKNPNSSNKCS